jgi:hypothetical protein
MWDMFVNSLKLFLKGKLFREPVAVLRQWLICCVLSVAAIVALTKAGLSLFLGVPVVALLGGALQPYLFRNLKYN